MSLLRKTSSNFVDIDTLKRRNGSNWVDIISAKRWSGREWIDVWPTGGKDLNKILDSYLAVGNVKYGESWEEPQSGYNEGFTDLNGKFKFELYSNLTYNQDWNGNQHKVVRPKPGNHLDLLGATRAYATISGVKFQIESKGDGDWYVRAFYFGSDGFLYMSHNVRGDDSVRDGQQEWIFDQTPIRPCDPSLIYGGILFSMTGFASGPLFYMSGWCYISDIKFIK